MMEIDHCPSTLAEGFATYSPKAVKLLFGGHRVNHLLDFEIDGVRNRQEMAEAIGRHIAWELEEKGEYAGCRELRGHLAWYTAGMQGGAALRKQASAITTAVDAQAFLQAFEKA